MICYGIVPAKQFGNNENMQYDFCTAVVRPDIAEFSVLNAYIKIIFQVCILLLLAVQVREAPARRKRQQHDNRIETDQYGDHYQSVDQDHNSQQYAHPFPISEDTTENSETPFYHSGNEFTDSENRFYESRNGQSRSKTRLDIQHTQPDNQFTRDESNPAQGRNNRHQNQPRRKQRRPHDSRYRV